MLVADCASVVLPLALLAFAVAMLRLDGQRIQEPTLKRLQNAINVIATVFPILFASVVGRMVYEAARWKLEQGTAMGSLEQLIGSRTVGSTFLTQLHLGRVNPLGVSLLFVWAFSPIGSQSILRALGSGLEQHVEPSTVVCFDSKTRSLLGEMMLYVGTGPTVVLFAQLASMFNALLLTPAATKTDSMDIWNNVRIPALDPSSSGTNDWHDVSGNPDLDFYSALVGVPVANVSVGNTSFSTESSYIDFQCANISLQYANASRGDKITEIGFEWDDDAPARPNGTWHGFKSSGSECPPWLECPAWSIAIDRFVDDYWANFTTVRSRFKSSFDPVNPILNSPRLFENDTDVQIGPTNLLFQASVVSGMGNMTGVRAICDVVQQYVESRVICSRSSRSSLPRCTVTAQRASRLNNPPVGITFLSFPETWKRLSSKLPQAAGLGLNTGDPVLRYLDDPRLNDGVSGTKGSLLYETDPSKFSRRLGQIINTYILLSQAFNAARDTSAAKRTLLEYSVTVPTQVSEDVAVYMVSRLWMALFILSCVVFLVSGTTSVIFAHLAVGPEVLGYASTVVRDSRFIELPPETGRMQGIDCLAVSNIDSWVTASAAPPLVLLVVADRSLDASSSLSLINIKSKLIMSATKPSPKTQQQGSLYQQLDKTSQQIRLLRILPGEKSQPLKCTLSIAGLKRRMGFEALSYVWGSPTPKCYVNINNRPVQIGPNLHAALIRLRREDKARVMWIDAVCINQADDLEKGHQVNLMSRIYTFANSVVAWLGDTPVEHEASCIKMLNDVRPPGDRLPEPRGKVNLEGLVGCTKTLMASPWFSRVWVVQESVLPRNLRIMVGPGEANFQDLNDKSVEFGKFLAKEGVRLDRNPYSGIQAMRKKKRYPSGSGVTLAVLLRDTQTRAATDVRDWTYALLGAVNDWQGYRPMLADYTVDERHVVFRTAFEVIRRQASLQFLVTTGLSLDSDLARERPEGSPSWVPPFSPAALSYAAEVRGTRPSTRDIQILDGEVLSMEAILVGSVDMSGSGLFPNGNDPYYYATSIYHSAMFEDLAKMTGFSGLFDFVRVAESLVGSKQHHEEPEVACLRGIFAQNGRLIRACNKRVAQNSRHVATKFDNQGEALKYLRGRLSEYTDTAPTPEQPDQKSCKLKTLKRVMQLWTCWCILDDINEKNPPPHFSGWRGFAEHIDDKDLRRLVERDSLMSRVHHSMKRLARLDGGAGFAVTESAQPGDRIFDLGGKSELFVLRPNGTRMVEGELVETYLLVEHCFAAVQVEDVDGTRGGGDGEKKKACRIYIC
ncbi:hypothetical protein ACJ41O_010319 [Fusarium nematophilum]